MSLIPTWIRPRSVYRKYSGWILICVATASPLLVYSAYRTVRSNANNVADWLPANYVETAQLGWFRQYFPEDQFIIVSWDGCRLGDDPAAPGAAADDPRIEQLAQWLEHHASPPPPATLASHAVRGNSHPNDQQLAAPSARVNGVMTGRRFLSRLTAPPISLPYAVAVQRLQGTLIGPDGHQTCLVVSLANATSSQCRAFLGHANAGLFRFRHREGPFWEGLRTCGIEMGSVHLGGPPVDNVAIDEEGERTMVRLAVLACLLGLGLSGTALRSVWLTFIVFTCGLLSAAAGLAAVWLSGQTADAVVLSMPTLIYVLAISNAVHLVNYYRDAIQEVGVEEAPWRAIVHGWKPTLLCSITTAIGLLSLYTSDLAPIRKFGLFSAVAMMLMLAVLLVYLPAALQFLPSGMGRGKDGPPSNSVSTAFLPPAHYYWFGLHRWILRHHVWVLSVGVLLITVVGAGVMRVKTSVDLMKFFRGEARILDDYRWLEANIGRLVPMEVVVRFSRDSLRPVGPTAGSRAGYTLLQREELVARVQGTMQHRFGSEGQDVIGPSLSAASFLPPLPARRRGTSAVVRRTIANARLESCYPALAGSGYLRIDPQTGDELWRISVRVAAFRGVDYGRFADEVRRLVDPLLEAHASDGAVPRPSAIYTGVVPIVYKAQRALLDSLISSAVWSFVTITPLLMFVSRGIRAGIVAMLPNALPVLVVFGGMGWLGLTVDIGAMMSASIALGVAVDDTIHFLTWFREDLQRTADRNAAILAAYRRTATPTLQAALINGLGLSVFAFSTFNPTKQLGYLMLTILMAGVVAELVLLPALLASPLGGVFEPRPHAGCC